jgi:hypothetical protein
LEGLAVAVGQRRDRGEGQFVVGETPVTQVQFQSVEPGCAGVAAAAVGKGMESLNARVPYEGREPANLGTRELGARTVPLRP